MYSKKIKCKDFNDVEREQTFYFNLMDSELVEMQASIDGGLTEYGKKIIESQNVPELMALFKKLILKAYGEKSADGTRFIKDDPVRGHLADEFVQTNFYSELLMEFLENPDSAVEFFTGIIPAKYKDTAEEATGHAYPPAIEKA